MYAKKIEKSNKDTYELIKIIGKGGFGEVYLAKNKEGEDVIVKKFVIRQEKNKKYILSIAKFEIEALIKISQNSDICNQYAVCYIDNYAVDDIPRIVTEYIHGEDLTKYMRRFTLSQRQDRDDILVDLIIGLDYLHKINITHQDIKEENIRWDDKHKRFRYIDWGLACLKKYCADSDDVKCQRPPCGNSGTLYTTPPEIKHLGGGNNSTFPMQKAHDIWSLGVVLLDWYRLPESKTIRDMYYIKDKRGFDALTKNVPYYLTQEQINAVIDQINNWRARILIRLLLERNWIKRLKNWSDIVSSVNIYVIPGLPETKKPKPIKLLKPKKDILTPEIPIPKIPSKIPTPEILTIEKTPTEIISKIMTPKTPPHLTTKIEKPKSTKIEKPKIIKEIKLKKIPTKISVNWIIDKFSERKTISGKYM